MSAINDSSPALPPSLALPKKRYDVQEYVSFLGHLSKLDANFVRLELSNNASVLTFEDEATYQAHLANGTYFPSELVRADPLPVTASVDGIELDDWSEILDASVAAYSVDITGPNSRFRTDPAQNAAFMDDGVSTLFSHLFIPAPGVGRVSLLSYVDFVFPYTDAARRADRADYIRRIISSFYELEQSTLSSRSTIDGVDYQALPEAGPPDRRSRYVGQPLNFLALGHTVQTRASRDDFFDTVTRVASLDFRLCWVLDRPRECCERVLVIIADQHSHFSIRQLLQRQRKAVSDWMLDACSEKLLAAVVTHCGRSVEEVRSLQNPLALWKFVFQVTSPFTKILSEHAFKVKFASLSSPSWSVFKREFLELLAMGSRIPDFTLPSLDEQFKRVREMIRCFPDQDDYKRATIDLMSPIPSILSLSDLFNFLDSLQRTADVMKLSHEEASNHHAGGGKKEKTINEHTVIKDRDVSRPLVAASPSSPSSEPKCRACGRDYGPGHRDVCPAKDKTCNDCGRKGHFAGNDFCPMKKQKEQKKQPPPPPPPSALKKSRDKAGPAVSEEEKKKAAREKRIAAARKLLEDEDPTAFSVPLSSPPSNLYQYQGQGHYPSANQMLPSPYYSSLAPPPPAYRPTQQQQSSARCSLRPSGSRSQRSLFPSFLSPTDRHASFSSPYPSHRFFGVGGGSSRFVAFLSRPSSHRFFGVGGGSSCFVSFLSCPSSPRFFGEGGGSSLPPPRRFLGEPGKKNSRLFAQSLFSCPSSRRQRVGHSRRQRVEHSR